MFVSEFLDLVCREITFSDQLFIFYKKKLPVE